MFQNTENSYSIICLLRFITFSYQIVHSVKPARIFPCPKLLLSFKQVHPCKCFPSAMQIFTQLKQNLNY